MKPLTLSKILQSQGLGSRKQCEIMIGRRQVRVAGEVVTNPNQTFDPLGFCWTLDDVPYTYHEKLYVMLHKPSGYECSQQPIHHPSVYSLLPPHFIARGVQCVGRLDQDTTGLLLLTDDGAMNHTLTHPKKHIAKTYLVTTKHPVSEAAIAQLLSGVLLHDEVVPCVALAAERVEPCLLRLTIAEGKYHQVKRMVAATENRVEALHRESMGPIGLGELPLGEWLVLPDLPKQIAEATALLAG